MSRGLDARGGTIRWCLAGLRRCCLCDGGPDDRQEEKKKNVDPGLEEIEADRQEEVSPWARAFGVSSDDLRGATSREDQLEPDELDPEKKGAR